MLAARGGGDEFIERGLERRVDRRTFQQGLPLCAALSRIDQLDPRSEILQQAEVTRR